MNKPPPPDPSKPFWTVAEFAAYIGLRPPAARAIVNARLVTVHHVGERGGRVRIKPSDAEAYLERCRTPAKGERPAPPPPKPKRVHEPENADGPMAKYLERHARRGAKRS